MQKKQKTPKTQWKMQKSVGRNAETIACDAEAAAWDAEAAFPRRVANRIQRLGDQQVFITGNEVTGCE